MSKETFLIFKLKLFCPWKQSTLELKLSPQSKKTIKLQQLLSLYFCKEAVIEVKD